MKALPKSILLVDDNELIRQALRRIIELSEFVVCGEAANGREAIDKAVQLRPDVIVLDMSMPVMNGLEAAQVLKQIMPTVPLILFTLHPDSILEKHARSAGIHAIVSKGDGPNMILVHARNLVAVPA